MRSSQMRQKEADDVGDVVLLSRKKKDGGAVLALPGQVSRYPELRYMGSKKKLLPWIHQVMETLDFDSALDAFSGTACVSYLLKATGHRVVSSDFLNFPSVVARATIENNRVHLDGPALKKLLGPAKGSKKFIQTTFDGVFYTPEDLRFLDRLSANIRRLPDPFERALAYSALFRSCLKKQPRGVFTLSGDLSRYDDGRRDLRLTIEEHFLEQVEVYNQAVFDNGRKNFAYRSDVFSLPRKNVDLVYLDPPYVPRADDNCYVKRYHFLEGLSCYWENLPIDASTKVKKIAKRHTPFSYKRTALDAFDRMFAKFAKSQIVLSYSSNGFPDLNELVDSMKRHKKTVAVFEKPHRYHFGNHVSVERAMVTEYLIVGR